MNPIERIRKKLKSGDRFIEELVDRNLSVFQVYYVISKLRKNNEIITYRARDKKNKQRFKYRLK